MPDENRIQIPGRRLAAGFPDFFSVHPKIHDIVQGVNGRVSRESGEKPENHDFRGRNFPQPEEGAKSRGGDIQKAMGRSR
jgi:hypothetical protein